MKPLETVDYSVLPQVNYPSDLRKLSIAELNTLAQEIRNLSLTRSRPPAATWLHRWARWS